MNIFSAIKKYIHAQHVCMFLETIARYLFRMGSLANDPFLMWFFEKRTIRKRLIFNCKYFDRILCPVKNAKATLISLF